MDHLLQYDPESASATIFLKSEAVFTEVVHAYSSKLIAIAFSITKNRVAAEDIVQEAFLKLWQKRNEIVFYNLGGWLYRVVANLSYQHHQRESMQLRVINSLSKTKEKFCTGVEEQLMIKENDRIVHSIINRLPEKQREVYHLSRVNGLGRNEIAHHLNVSPNTVKVHLSRAQQFVKEHMVSLALFSLFFIFNNIFFKQSNTNPAPNYLYNVKQVVQQRSPGKEIACYRPAIQSKR